MHGKRLLEVRYSFEIVSLFGREERGKIFGGSKIQNSHFSSIYQIDDFERF